MGKNVKYECIHPFWQKTVNFFSLTRLPLQHTQLFSYTLFLFLYFVMNIKINEHQIWRKYSRTCVCVRACCIEMPNQKMADFRELIREHSQYKIVVELENYACTIMSLRLKRIQPPKIRKIAKKNTLPNHLQSSWVHWNRSKCIVPYANVRMNRISAAATTAAVVVALWLLSFIFYCDHFECGKPTSNYCIM